MQCGMTATCGMFFYTYTCFFEDMVQYYSSVAYNECHIFNIQCTCNFETKTFPVQRKYWSKEKYDFSLKFLRDL